MYLDLRAVAGMMFSVVVVSAQSLPSGRDGGLRPYPANGRVIVHAHPRDEVANLETLVAMSKLIVEGTVVSTERVIDTSLNSDVPEVETHSAFVVNKVLSGRLPGGKTTILLAQQGGKVGKWDVIPEDDPLVKSGERYILFLAPDERKHPSNPSGTPRLYTVGAYAGRVTLESGKILFLPAADSRLRRLNGTEEAAFIKIIDDEVHHRVMPPSRGNQIPHPGLPAKP